MGERKARKPAALIAAEKRIEELEKKVSYESSSKDQWYKSYNEIKKEVDGLHDILDSLGIPRKNPEIQYNGEYSLSVRLFAWATKK